MVCASRIKVQPVYRHAGLKLLLEDTVPRMTDAGAIIADERYYPKPDSPSFVKPTRFGELPLPLKPGVRD